MPDPQPTYLTTREVADLLRVKERKVYDLAAANDIPHRRITGKLLFPAAEIMAWIEGSGASGAEDRPAVVTGSHDPLLDWAIRESGASLATLWTGSRDGLSVFAKGKAAMAGLHLPEDDGWNLATVAAEAPANSVLIAWAGRQRGLLVRSDAALRIADVSDLRGYRLVRRQPGAGAAALMERLLSQAGLTEAALAPDTILARTETEAAAAVAAGEADAALGIAAMARSFNLAFVPLVTESYDLLIDRRSYFTEPVQTLLSFARTDAFLARGAALGGYDLNDTGSVRWLGP